MVVHLCLGELILPPCIPLISDHVFCVHFIQSMLPRSRPKAPLVMQCEAGLWKVGPHQGERVLLSALNADSKQLLSLRENCLQVLILLGGGCDTSIYKGGCDMALGRKPLCGVMEVIFYQTGHHTHHQISLETDQSDHTGFQYLQLYSGF